MWHSCSVSQARDDQRSAAETVSMFGKPLLVAVLVTVLTAGIGGWLTDIGPWYKSLKTPAWKPPDWAFGPIWTTILTLVAFAAAMAWNSAADAPDLQQRILLLFLANAVLNVLWNVCYFTLKRPDWALIEVAFLWLSIAALVVVIWPVNQTASLMLVPYLVWVAIASVLNRAVVKLNPAFG
jgi:translocator protein